MAHSEGSGKGHSSIFRHIDRALVPLGGTTITLFLNEIQYFIFLRRLSVYWQVINPFCKSTRSFLVFIEAAFFPLYIQITIYRRSTDPPELPTLEASFRSIPVAAAPHQSVYGSTLFLSNYGQPYLRGIT